MTHAGPKGNLIERIGSEARVSITKLGRPRRGHVTPPNGIINRVVSREEEVGGSDDLEVGGTGCAISKENSTKVHQELHTDRRIVVYDRRDIPHEDVVIEGHEACDNTGGRDSGDSGGGGVCSLASPQHDGI